MAFYPSSSNARWYVLLSLLATWPVYGQQGPDPSKPLEQSPPDMPFVSHESTLPEALRPGGSFFSSGKSLPAFDILPGSPQPSLSPEQVRQWQKLLDNRKNWTLMTPEEILGVPTAAKILGVPDPDDDQNLSATERYIKRMNRESKAVSATNALGAEDDSWLGSDAKKDQRKIQPGGIFDNQIWGNAPKQTDIERQAAEQKTESIWTSAFPHPMQAPKPDPQQLAEKERFEILLGTAAPPKPPGEVMLSTKPILPVVDPNMQVLPEANAAGGTFSSLRDNASRPIGIMPLPSITARPRPISTRVQESYAPKLPPWMSSGPPAPGTLRPAF
jgi:hypothetical protein